MRKLKTKDLFVAVRAIKEIGVREEIKKITMKLDKNTDVNEAGIDVFLAIFEKATEKKSEKVIYDFLSGPFEVTPEEVEEMELFEMIEKLKEIADIGKWRGFLSSAAQLMK